MLLRRGQPTSRKHDLTVYSIDGVTPVVDPTAYVHPSAVLIGDVIVGPRCYIGPAALPARRFRPHRIRAGANIQDTCVCTRFPATTRSSRKTATSATAPCCTAASWSVTHWWGMNAVVNDNAVIGESAIVAAMAFVKAGMVVPPRTLVAGIPARVMRTMTEMEIAWKEEGTEATTSSRGVRMATMSATAPLAAPEPERKRLDLPEICRCRCEGKR